MFNPTKLMKIFEVLWISAAIIALVMGITKLASGAEATSYGYLFMITVLCSVMFVIKRKSRQWLEARDAQRQSQNP